MKYLLMCCTQEKDWAAMPADERHSPVEETLAYCRVLWEGGHLLAAAMTVRVRGGEVSVTDGPFTETREQLGGYFLVEAKDLDAAIAIAARIPMARKGTVAVKLVIDIPGLPTSLSVTLDVYFRNSSKNPSSTSNVCFGTTPSSSFSNVSRSVSPSTSSIGGTPSRLASFLASSVNVPVVMMMPLSARPIMAPLKSRTCEGATAPL
ncbi:MAG: YciI family protein [Nitrospira sp.]